MSMGTSLRSYYRGHTLVSMRDGQANASRYYHFDGQGTTQCLTNEAGVVTDRFAADAWGVEVRRTGSSINRAWYVGRAGYYRHADQALDYVQARFLFPRTARWLSVDPSMEKWLSGHPIEGAQYGYVGNGPVTRIDPSGFDMYECEKKRCPKDAWTEVPNLPAGHESRCRVIRKEYEAVKSKCQKEQSGKPDYDINHPEATTYCGNCVGELPKTGGGPCFYLGPGKYRYCEGCIQLMPHFFNLSLPYQICIFEHEQRRVQCCTSQGSFDGGCTLVGPPVSDATEVYRILDCVGMVLKSCGLSAGPCKAPKPVPKFDKNSCTRDHF